MANGIDKARTGRNSFPRLRNASGARQRCRGFKLVEFLVVLAIASTVGITAVSASYGSSEDRLQAQRMIAQSMLAEMAVLEQDYFLFNKRYTRDTGPEGLGLDSTTTPGNHYELRVDFPQDACPAGYCYVLSAVPQGAQADDECGALKLTSDGTRLPAGCW